MLALVRCCDAVITALACADCIMQYCLKGNKVALTALLNTRISAICYVHYLFGGTANAALPLIPYAKPAGTCSTQSMSRC
jgi:hypothetical protein